MQRDENNPKKKHENNMKKCENNTKSMILNMLCLTPF